jgi:integrase
MVMKKPSLSKTGRAAKTLKPTKPEKPYAEYPLTPHASGKWCKKVRGKIHYFGTWDNPDGAMQEWLAAKDDGLHLGADPKRNDDRIDIERVCNMFLDAKEQQRDQGDLSTRALNDYHDACKRFSAFIGKSRFIDTMKTSDFARYRGSFPKSWGPVRINTEIARLSVLLNYAYEAELVDKPIRTGPNFSRVSQKKQRLHRATRPKKIFTAGEIHRMIDASNVQMKAMIYLGINAGYGNADCGRLQIDEIDFAGSWLEGLREKTGIERAAWLWPETIAALQDAINAKYSNVPESLEGNVFVTKRRHSWHHDDGKAQPLSAEFKKTAERAKCYRVGVGFYALRHVFETIAGNAKDQIAVNYVMGHTDATMADVYREGIDPQRIKDVCSFVRDWFIAGKPDEEPDSEPNEGADAGGEQ